MSRFNELLHGEAATAAELLSGEVTPARDEILLELRAALTNALNRIDRLEAKAIRLAPASKIYKVIVQKMVAFGRVHELDEDVEGTYPYTAISEDDALDQFHSTVPIKMLEDFEITAVEIP